MITTTLFEETKLKLKEIIANDLDVNIKMEEIKDDVSLFEEGIGLDSISIVNFIVLVEKKFNMFFAEEEMSTRLFDSIDTLAQAISEKLNSK